MTKVTHHRADSTTTCALPLQYTVVDVAGVMPLHST